MLFDRQPSINDLKRPPLLSLTHVNLEGTFCRLGIIVVIETVMLNKVLKIIFCRNGNAHE
jgi:hypothetical protein